MEKIIFFNYIDGVAQTYPIIESKNQKFNWVKSARDSYVESLKKAEGERFDHIYQCPGIFEIMEKGYIVPMPWDVMVETNGDRYGFKWTLPSKELSELNTTPLIHGHMADGLAATLPKDPSALESIVKFNTSWHVVAPRGIKLLVLPIPYPDDFSFEMVPGILDPGYSTEINFQLKWKILNGKHIVKAGTPMCQIIPLTGKKLDLEVRTANDNDRRWLKVKKFLFGHNFTPKRNLWKEKYLKHFNL